MVTREDMVEQTVSDLVRLKLTEHDYIPNVVDMREAFPSADERASELVKSQVALGFTFDDGGTPAEMGSDLCVYTHTVEFWCFGLNVSEGRNPAQFIKQIFRSNMSIPLKDVGQAGQPVIAYLEVPDRASVSTRRQISREPFPWDRFVWSTTVKLQDWYAPEAL